MASKGLPPAFLANAKKFGGKPAGKPAGKPSSPALEKREEKVHKDLDHDGERGESAAHKAKVFGKPAAKKSVGASSAKKPNPFAKMAKKG